MSHATSMLWVATPIFFFWLGHYWARRTSASRPRHPDDAATTMTSTTAAARDLEGSVLQLRTQLATQRDALEAALRKLDCVEERDEATVSEHARLLHAARELLTPARALSRDLVHAYDELRCKTDNFIHVSQTRTDALTGLSNELVMQEWLRMMFALMSRYQYRFSLVMLDIDGFSSYRRAEGTEAAHEVLRKLGRLLKSSVRETDYVFRLQGDRFAVALPETSLAGAEVFATRVHGAIREKLILPVSIGVALAQEDDNTRCLVERVSAAIFAAKSQGGNGIFRHTGHVIEMIERESPAVLAGESV